MVAVITSGTSIRRMFHYNENKVKEGAAVCLMAANYPMDLSDMNEHHRINMLLKTAAKNPDVKRSSIHISLNFAPGEQLSDDLLRSIAADYMERIGFGQQPYLVYRHDDAGHPHIHIASVKIRPDGSPIVTQNIGRNQSQKAREELELKYNLVVADRHKRQVFSIKPVDAQRVIYGKSDTRRAIGNVLEAVLKSYRYTSIPELNAILNQYNVAAERGSEDSRTYKNRGLYYRVLDHDGHAVGVPVKASSFHQNPGLRFLEEQFLKNDVLRQPHTVRVKNAIDFALLRANGITLQQLSDKLKREGIHLALRQNKEGVIYGLTCVDHRNKCVFNGSALGKNYSAKAILERCNALSDQSIQQGAAAIKVATIPVHKQPGSPAEITTANPATGISIPDFHESGKSLLSELMRPEYIPDTLPVDPKRKKKKKKKPRL